MKIIYNQDIRTKAIEILEVLEQDKNALPSILSQLLISQMVEQDSDVKAAEWLDELCKATKQGFTVLIHPEKFEEGTNPIN